MPREEWKRERVRGLQLVSEAYYHDIKDNYSMYVFIKMCSVYLDISQYTYAFHNVKRVK